MACQTAGQVIVYHGTTAEHKASILSEGLRPNSYVAATRELATEYAHHRGLTRGSDGYVIFEVDVPDAAVVEVQSWWWANGQLCLPFGAPPEGITVVEADLPPEDEPVAGAEPPAAG
jgi:RNA:NAD 2'-phosphotransferase (TPT1/KptA family)